MLRVRDDNAPNVTATARSGGYMKQSITRLKTGIAAAALLAGIHAAPAVAQQSGVVAAQRPEPGGGAGLRGPRSQPGVEGDAVEVPARSERVEHEVGVGRVRRAPGGPVGEAGRGGSEP